MLNFPAALKWCVAFVIAQWLMLPDITRSLLLGLVILMALDYVTGMAAAWVSKSVSSEIGSRGLVKKGLILILLLSVHILERLAGIELHLEATGAIGFAVNEVISVIENCARAGVWMPEKLVAALIAVQKLRGSGATAEQLAQLRAGIGKNTGKS